MRSTALATKDEYNEVPVSSTEVLEANVVAIRADLNELKANFSAAVTRIDNDIKAAVMRLEAEIRAMGSKFETEIRRVAEKAQSDLERLATRLDTQLQELRVDNKALRERVDKNHETLIAKIDATNDRIELTNEKLNNLDRKITDIGSKLTALLWVVGGLGTLITIAITAGKALRWF
jgi:chromosome segregation ATPase